VRYLNGQRYDPSAMTRVLKTLDRVGRTEREGSLPNWLSTHPSPEDRIERVADITAPGGRDERTGYLRRLDGLTFGEDPREGYFENGVFYHPELHFRLGFPRGWRTQNARHAVSAMSPQEDAAVVLSLAGTTSPRQAAQEFVSRSGLNAGRPRGDADDVSLEFEARDGSLRGRARFVEHGSRTYRLLGYASRPAFNERRDELEDSLESFRGLDDRRYLDVEPRRLDIVTPDRTMSIAEFAERYPSTVPVTTLALINGIEDGERLPAGQPAKRVVGGSRRADRVSEGTDGLR
jgi:predicted Zn-dependent protease